MRCYSPNQLPQSLITLKSDESHPLEEHFRSKHADSFAHEYYRQFSHVAGTLGAYLDDIGADRIADMDKNGIDVQVLSHTVASPEVLEAARAVPLCQRVNDELAEAIAKYPARLAGFACLPIADPEQAANELERTVRQLGLKGAMVQGVTHGHFFDEPFLYPILERAESLDVPIYLHPAPPPEPVMRSYFAGLAPAASILATAGWGWHAETALHTLRMIAAGTFDRFPKLQFIIGHMGEMIPFQLARHRCRPVPRRERASAESSRVLPIETSTSRPAACSPRRRCTWRCRCSGADRILFSIDYPYSPNEVWPQLPPKPFPLPGGLRQGHARKRRTAAPFGGLGAIALR